MKIKLLFFVILLSVCVAGPAVAQQVAAPEAQAGSISGTVMDVNDDIIPGATVVLEGLVPAENQSETAKDDGSFHFSDAKAGVPYHVQVSADGFVTWTSPAIVLNPGQFLFLAGSKLQIAGGATSVTVFSSPTEMAVEQVKLEEKQRVLGIVPNFYVAYDHDAAPLTKKLKFSLALKAETDPVTVIGIGLVAGMDQAGATPNYGMGAEGYAQRFGALYANGFSDIMIGGAILPSLLHQDPRYFYQGTGTKKSRVLHAISSPFICKGDNGRWEPNYSSIGGDLASGAISNAYYPETNRGPGLVFDNALVTTGGRMVNGIIQEFVLRRFTSGAKEQTF